MKALMRRLPHIRQAVRPHAVAARRRDVPARRLLLAVATAAAVGATVVAPAAADRPLIIDDTFPLAGRYFVGSAPLVCPGGYTPRVVGIIDRRRIQTYGEDGSLLLERRHVDFRGTMSNTLTGYTVPYFTHWNRVFDAVANTVTSTGLTRQLVAPGEGLLSFDAGRTVLDLDTNEIVFSAGSHEFDTELCSVLSH